MGPVCSQGASILFCFRALLSIVFRFFFNYSACVFVILFRFASYFQLFSVSCPFVRALFPLFCIASSTVVFLLPLSFCFSGHSRHTNVVSFAIFPSFLSVFFFSFRFAFLFCVLSLFMCVCIQRIASKSANYLDVWISTTSLTAETYPDELFSTPKTAPVIYYYSRNLPR